MRLTYQDIILSREWAQEYSGEDNPLDVYAHKMLSFALKQHEDAKSYHEGQIEKIRAEMATIEAGFKVDDEGF